MPSAVVDASVIVALVVPETHSDWADEAFSRLDEAYVLDLTFYEVYNTLWKKRYLLGEITEDVYAEALSTAKALMLEAARVASFDEVIDEAAKIAASTGLTVYDSSYLALAVKKGVRFVTLNIKIKSKLEGTEYYGAVVTPPAEP